MFAKKLGQQGITHLLVIALAAVVIGGVAFTGTKVLTKSHAAVCIQYTFRQGSSGPCVVDIQRINNEAGGTVPKVAVDGSFGPATNAQVKALQKSELVAADGVVGAKTWQMICFTAKAEKLAAHNTNTAGYLAGKAAGCWI